MTNFNAQLDALPQHQKVWIHQLLTFIHQAQGHTDLSANELARQFMMSERQFYRKVKQNLNLTPNQLVRKIKMQKAKAYLEAGAFATVAELAYNLGYNHPEYFSNVFHTTFGKRPSYYLKHSS